jgi:hypothetical protein
VGACAPEEPSNGSVFDASETWTLGSEPLLQIGVVSGEDPYQLDDVTSATRLDDGRIVVANNGSKEIRFYDVDGNFIDAVGREGDAPGEYRILDRVRMAGADTLLVFDTNQPRISVLDPATGEYLGAASIPEDEAFPFDEWIHGRTIVDSPLSPDQRGVVAAALDRLPMFEGSEHRYARVTREGHVWVASAKMPRPGEAVSWRIHDLEGVLLASLTTPEAFVVHDMGPDWVLGEWHDSLDVEYVRLYELHRPSTPATPDLASAAASWSGPSPSFHRLLGIETETAISAMKRMATSEEIFYAMNGHYTLSLDSLRRANPRFEVAEGIELTPLWGEDNGWMYMAVDTGLDATCFISYGVVRIIGRPSGELACWASGERGG